jgi:hypothetical protein
MGPQYAMREFQVYLLDIDDHIIMRKDLAVESLESATILGFEAMRQHNSGTLVNRAVAIEIWSGTHRLFAGDPDLVAPPVSTAAEFRAKGVKLRELAAQTADRRVAEVLSQLARDYEAETEQVENRPADDEPANHPLFVVHHS